MAEDPNATAPNATQSAGGLALYRKYRPATFAEVRGQEHVTEPLRQALKSGRINHAYLFSGPRGCGKTSSARIMARSLNCVQGPTPDPCGECESCVALAPSGPGSIDVIEIDAASHGGVDDARDLRERAFYAPVSGRYKIYIIDEAHMVTSQGFNALLKLVEEPPPHLKFVFATTEPDKVIPTIRSRTHHYPFRLMPPSVMSGLMTDILNDEAITFDPAVIPLVVQAGGGSARDSLSILDQLMAGSDENGIAYDRAVALLGFTDASLLDEAVSAFAANDGARVFGVVNRVIEGGHEPRRFATDMLDRFRDLIVLAQVPDAIDTGLLNVPPDRVEPLKQQAAWGMAQLTRAADIVSTGLDHMRGATSPRLLLELMCAQVLLPAVSADERSLLARLERLESGMVSASTPTPSSSERISVPRPPQVPSSPAQEAPPSASAPASDPVPTSAAVSSALPTGDESAVHTPPAGSAALSSASSAGEQASAGGRAPAPSSAPAPRGGLTTDALRQDWPQVLELIKRKGKVPWIIIHNGVVESLDEHVLTLRFQRQGDLKGFAAGPYEDILKQTLAERYGVHLTVRPVSGPDTGSGGGGPRRPAPAPQQPPAQGQAPEPPRQAPPSERAPAAPERQERPAAPGGPGNAPGAGEERRSVRNNRGDDFVPPPPEPPDDDDDFYPDDDDMSSGPATVELSGVGLIQRELGGEIIGEYED